MVFWVTLCFWFASRSHGCFAVELLMKGMMMVSGFSMAAREDWWWSLKEKKT